MNIRKVDRIFYQLKEILNSDLDLLDETGYIIKSTNDKKVGEIDKNVLKITKRSQVQKIGSRIYYIHTIDLSRHLILSVGEIREEGERILPLIGMFLSESIHETSLQSFIQGTLLGEYSTIQTRGFLEKYDIPVEKDRRIILLSMNKEVSEEIEDLFIEIDPNIIWTKMYPYTYVFMQEADHGNDSFNEKVSEFTATLFNTIYTDFMIEPKISVGTCVEKFDELIQSYQKAKRAMELGKIFLPDEKIYWYENMMFPLYIAHMDQEEYWELWRQMKYKHIDIVLEDQELLHTAKVFFQMNLNITDTSNQLFIHRNTLIYRLNKIEKLTGFDLRIFDDAIQFKGIMYMQMYNEKKNTI